MLALVQRTKKQLAAAVTLAAVYAAGVIVLLLMMLVLDDPPIGVLRTLPFLGIPALVCFAIAFLLLAVARRAGFTALWVVILGLWVASVAPAYRLFRVPAEFTSWSVFAAPLYAMVVFGFPRRLAAGPARWRLWASMAVAPAWIALFFVAAFPFYRFAPTLEYMPLAQRVPHWLWRPLLLAWLAFPPALTLAGILRVYSRAPTDAIHTVA